MKTNIHSAVPVIATDDIQKSITYYTEVLGFDLDFTYGNPHVFAGVKSGEVEIYFTHDPAYSGIIKEKNLHPEIFIWVSEATSLFQRHVAKGAELFEPLSDRPWGARQYVLRDINGYHLKFAQPI